MLTALLNQQYIFLGAQFCWDIELRFLQEPPISIIFETYQTLRFNSQRVIGDMQTFLSVIGLSLLVGLSRLEVWIDSSLFLMTGGLIVVVTVFYWLVMIRLETWCNYIFSYGLLSYLRKRMGYFSTITLFFISVILIQAAGYWYQSGCWHDSVFMVSFSAFSFQSRGVCFIVMVLRRLGNFFFKGLVIYRLVEDSFHAVSKYLFSTFLSFCYSSKIVLLLSQTFPMSSPLSMRYDSRSSSTFLMRSPELFLESAVQSLLSSFSYQLILPSYMQMIRQVSMSSACLRQWLLLTLYSAQLSISFKKSLCPSSSTPSTIAQSPSCTEPTTLIRPRCSGSCTLSQSESGISLSKEWYCFGVVEL